MPISLKKILDFPQGRVSFYSSIYFTIFLLFFFLSLTGFQDEQFMVLLRAYYVLFALLSQNAHLDTFLYVYRFLSVNENTLA